MPHPLDKYDLGSEEQNGEDHYHDPERCTHCGSRRLGNRLETISKPDPCTDDVTDCTCCYCPGCGAKSIYHRETKSPDFRCINCKHTFDDPVKPDWRETDYHPRPCRSCGGVTLGP